MLRRIQRRDFQMSLISEWRDMAYSATANKGDLQRLWQDYFQKEKEIYAQLLADPDTEVKGTVEELAEKYGITLMYMTGFLDGINDSLKVANDIEAMEKDTEVSLGFDKEKLFRNMVDAKADWLYGLPEWDDIYSKEEQEELIKDQKKSHTFVREGRKVGRNEPCPCGSGKKYKNCCGRDA